jgi:hypothetical protein
MHKNTMATVSVFLFPARKQIKITKKAGHSITNQAIFGFILIPHPVLVKRPYGALTKNSAIKTTSATKKRV